MRLIAVLMALFLAGPTFADAARLPAIAPVMACADLIKAI